MRNVALLVFLITSIFLVSVCGYSESSSTVPIQVKNGIDRFKALRPRFFHDGTGEGRYKLHIQEKEYPFIYKDGGFLPEWKGANIDGSDKNVPVYLGGCFKLPVKLKEREVDYQVEVGNFGSTGDWVGLKCNTYLEVKVFDKVICFIDWNINGRFDDIGIDLICVDDSKPLMLNRFIAFGEGVDVAHKGLYEWAIAEDGQKMSFRKSADATANLTVVFERAGDKVLNLKLVEKTLKSFVSMSETNTAIVKPGKYDFVSAAINVQDRPGQYFVFSGRSKDGKPVIDIKPGENKLRLGPPFKMRIKVVKVGDDSVRVEDVMLIGAAGEQYAARAYSSERRIGSSLTLYQEFKGVKRKICKLEYG